MDKVKVTKTQNKNGVVWSAIVLLTAGLVALCYLNSDNVSKDSFNILSKAVNDLNVPINNHDIELRLKSQSEFNNSVDQKFNELNKQTTTQLQINNETKTKFDSQLVFNDLTNKRFQEQVDKTTLQLKINDNHQKAIDSILEANRRLKAQLTEEYATIGQLTDRLAKVEQVLNTKANSSDVDALKKEVATIKDQLDKLSKAQHSILVKKTYNCNPCVPCNPCK